jgi:hypothetical protein
MNKILHFSSTKSRSLRELTHYVQQRVLELRQQQYHWQEFEQTPLPSTPREVMQEAFAPQPQAQTATPAMPLINPSMAAMRRPAPRNHFAKVSLTTKHNFLPKVPRRYRPDGT